MYMRLFILFFVFIFSFQIGVSQFKGYPIIKNLSQQTYNGGSRIYSLLVDESGIAYAGDKNGILEFDGEEWNKIHCGYTVTSIAKDSLNNIYVSGTRGIGVLKDNENNTKQFISLNHYISSEHELKKIRHSKVYNLNGEIIFVLDNKILIDANKKLNVIELPYKFSYSQIVNNELYLYSADKGLFKLSNGEIKAISNSNNLLNRSVVGLCMMNHKLHFIINQSGVYSLNKDKLEKSESELSQFASENFIYGTTQIDKDKYVLKTFYQGIVVFNKNNKILSIHNYSNGLINNTVFSTYFDSYNNLWVGTAAGISIYRFNFPITKHNTPQGIGTGYGAIKYKNKLYLATSLGLYYVDKNKLGNISYNKIFEGHVWSLKIFDNKLCFGHPSGYYSWDNKNIKKISNVLGIWDIIKIKDSENLYISNSVSGLVILKKEKNNFNLVNRIKGFNYLSKEIEFDSKNKLWALTDHSICNMEFDQDFKTAKNIRYFDRISTNNNLTKFFKLDNEMHFAADSGIYKFNYATETFSKNHAFDDIFSLRKEINNVIVDNYKRVWIFNDKNYYIAVKKGNKFVDVYNNNFKITEGLYPEKYENVYAIDSSNIIIGIEEGFFSLSLSDSEISVYSKAMLRKIYLTDDKGVQSNIWGNEKIDSSAHFVNINKKIPYNQNSIKFEFSSGAWNYNKVQYKTFLIGHDKEWGKWTDKNYREFTNLPAGDYKFIIRAINNYDEYSFISCCSFKILPPWYLNSYAKLTYLVLALGLFLGIYFLSNYFIKTKHKRELKKQETLFKNKEQEQIKSNLKREKELIKLRNLKLSDENLRKSKELANNTMNIINKNKFLIDIKEELDKLRKLSEQNKIITQDIKILIRKINNNIEDKQNWNVFEEYFDSVHENFFKKINKKFPNLTSKDLRLCAYIKMNLSTKEIAPLLNITVRGVEISRYRLRKKLNLDRSDNINEFLLKI